MNKFKFFMLGLVFSTVTLLCASMEVSKVDGIVDIDSPENKKENSVIYIASKNSKDYLAMTDESGSFSKAISPTHKMITSFAICPQKELIAYGIRDKYFKPRSFLKEGIEAENRPFGKNMIPADFSSDCKTLLYTSADKKGYLYSYDMQTGKSKLLLKKAVVTARWSGDNSSILLWVMSGVNWAGDLYVLSYPSLHLKRLTKTVKIEEINPSYINENLIIFGTSVHASGKWKLATYKLNSGDIKDLGVQGNYAVVSSKKEKILYVNDDVIHSLDMKTMEDKIIAKGKMPQVFSDIKPFDDCASANLFFDDAMGYVEEGNYKKALDVYRKGYSLCPLKDVEEMMAWLLGEVGNEDEFAGELTSDIDHDNRLEVAKWSKFASDAYTDYYQLVLIDDDGKIMWEGSKDMNRSNPLVFVASDFGISTPEILADIDQDGYTELLAPEMQSDVSPTFYRRLRWKGNKFEILPSKALMCSEANPKHFKWVDNESGKGTWISGMSQNKPHSNGLVKVSVIRNNSKTCSRMGTALVRFGKDGATVVQWIKTIFCDGS